jgi:hypothetical protein
VFGISFIAAHAISAKVEGAVARHRLRRTPPRPRVAGPEEIDARLDAVFAEMTALTTSGRPCADVESAVADARARVEEWTA